MVGCSLDECSATELPRRLRWPRARITNHHNTMQSKGSQKPLFTHVYAYILHVYWKFREFLPPSTKVLSRNFFALWAQPTFPSGNL